MLTFPFKCVCLHILPVVTVVAACLAANTVTLLTCLMCNVIYRHLERPVFFNKLIRHQSLKPDLHFQTKSGTLRSEIETNVIFIRLHDR